MNAPGGGQLLDFQESFLFAEVMKYRCVLIMDYNLRILQKLTEYTSYLIHAPDAPWQVAENGDNQYVYNTEAHPLKVRRIYSIIGIRMLTCRQVAGGSASAS